jgi:hypothetical protein
MGKADHLAALAEMEHAVMRWLDGLTDPGGTAVTVGEGADRSPPDLTALLAEPDPWTDWRRRLTDASGGR